MSARERLERICGPQTPPELIAELDAYRAEVLAADGQDYPGELAMLRGLVRTLRVEVRADDASLDAVRQRLWQHVEDERAARTEARNSRADTAPDKLTAREQRLAQLLDTIRTHGGKWSAGSVQQLRRVTGGPVQRGTARRDLIELARRGHLAQYGAADGRYYTLTTRKDGRA